MKYIVYEDKKFDVEAMIIFPPFVEHKTMADKLGHEVLSAGFIGKDGDVDYRCYGHSTSLDIYSRGQEDTRILNRQLSLCS